MALVRKEFRWRACQADIALVGGYYCLYLVEDHVCIALWRGILEFCYGGICLAHYRRECFSLLGLWQVCHHYCRIEPTFRHLVKVNECGFVASVEAYSLWEEHRGVAMGVESQYAVVKTLRLVVERRLPNEPTEQGLTLFHALRMPLHSYYRLVLAAFHGFHYTVCRTCGDTKLFACLCHRLMMERVDIEGVAAIDRVQHRLWFYIHCVSRLATVGILTVFDNAFAQGDVLLHTASEGHCQCLYATANTENRHLSVVGESGYEQFRQIALTVYGVQSC